MISKRTLNVGLLLAVVLYFGITLWNQQNPEWFSMDDWQEATPYYFTKPDGSKNLIEIDMVEAYTLDGLTVIVEGWVLIDSLELLRNFPSLIGKDPATVWQGANEVVKLSTRLLMSTYSAKDWYQRNRVEMIAKHKKPYIKYMAITMLTFSSQNLDTLDALSNASSEGEL